MKEAMASLEAYKVKAAEDKVDLEKVFNVTKDSHMNYAYIMAFVEAIRLHRCTDPTGDLSSLARDLADYVRDSPPDPSYFLEI